MPKEIERKFLVDLSALDALGLSSLNLHPVHNTPANNTSVNNDPVNNAPINNGVNIKQGYITTTSNTVVRARVAGDKAFLTLKGENKGITRSEFEYAIPVDDANHIISELCNGPVVEKVRHLVVHAGHHWEVDFFKGDNEGLVLAEIELSSEEEVFELPPWVTHEVSGDPKYYNSNLLEMPYKRWI